MLAIVLSFGCEGSDSLEQATQLRVSVTRVVDGDTLLVSDSGVTREVHLSHLECPELTQPSGVDAALWMAERCEGREVVVVEFRRDKADLCGVVMVDGVNLNLDLSRAGYAQLCDPSSADPAVVDAVGEAQLQFRGLWKAFATPIEPAAWRKMTAGLQPDSDRPLEGIWEVTSAKWKGKENPGSLGAYYIFCGGKQTTCESPFNIESQFVLDPSKDPARIDFKREMPKGTVEISGIYQLEGDRLTRCSSRQGQDRPRVFDSSTSDVGSSLIELRRVTVPERFGALRD